MSRPTTLRPTTLRPTMLRPTTLRMAVTLPFALLVLSACGPAAPAAAPAATALPAEQAPTSAMTDTMPMTDTMEMTDTMKMTDTMHMSDTTEMADSMHMTDTVEMSDTMEMTGTMELTDTMHSDAMPATDAMPAGEQAARPSWQTVALTDARTGSTFTLADFAGKTVLVEPFATWCPNCKQQLGNVQAAKQQAAALGRDDVVFVALSVEPNIGNEALAAYAADTGYDLVFAAMPPELLQALAAEFGQTIANPPATPHFVIQPDGTTGALVTGIQPVEAVLAQVGVQP